MSNQTFTVSGMTCGHCATSVTEELSDITGVTDVKVSVDTGEVVVTSEPILSKDAANAAVTEAGYSISQWAATA